MSEIPVVKVTDRATEKDPLRIEFEHDTSIDYRPVSNVKEDSDLFNFLVDSDRRSVGLYVSLEWSSPSASNIDLYLYDDVGEQFAWSEWFNNPVADAAYEAAFDDHGHGGMGYESILGYKTRGCFGFTALSSASITPGEEMTIKVWLGKPQPNW